MLTQREKKVLEAKEKPREVEEKDKTDMHIYTDTYMGKTFKKKKRRKEGMEENAVSTITSM